MEGRATKMCASVIQFIPSLNHQNQLFILIINFYIYISNKTNIICCNWCNVSDFQPSSRAQVFGFKRTKLSFALLTDRCANRRGNHRHWKRFIYIERITGENKYLERENKSIIPSLIDFMTDRFCIVILFVKRFHGSANFVFQTRYQSVFTE